MLRLAALLLLIAAPAAAETIRGPVEADVVSVYDGDTLQADVLIWIGTTHRTAVRIRGIDAPELKGRCDGERIAARAARDALAGLAGGRVLLWEISPDKYGGRVDARVTTPEGIDLGERMVEMGHARRYSGGWRGSWCQ